MPIFDTVMRFLYFILFFIPFFLQAQFKGLNENDWFIYSFQNETPEINFSKNPYYNFNDVGIRIDTINNSSQYLEFKYSKSYRVDTPAPNFLNVPHISTNFYSYNQFSQNHSLFGKNTWVENGRVNLVNSSNDTIAFELNKNIGFKWDFYKTDTSIIQAIVSDIYFKQFEGYSDTIVEIKFKVKLGINSGHLRNFFENNPIQIGKKTGFKTTFDFFLFPYLQSNPILFSPYPMYYFLIESSLGSYSLKDSTYLKLFDFKQGNEFKFKVTDHEIGWVQGKTYIETNTILDKKNLHDSIQYTIKVEKDGWYKTNEKYYLLDTIDLKIPINDSVIVPLNATKSKVNQCNQATSVFKFNGQDGFFWNGCKHTYSQNTKANAKGLGLIYEKVFEANVQSYEKELFSYKKSGETWVNILNVFPQNNQIEIFPNPTQGAVIFTQIVEDISIYNLNGQLVFKTIEKKAGFDLNLPNGIYVVSFVFKGSHYSKKLIVN